MQLTKPQPQLSGTRPPSDHPPKRTAPYEDEPGFYVPGHLWLYGNVRLLAGNLAYVPTSFGHPSSIGPVEWDAIEREAEELVLSGKTLVCGIHNAAHQKAAIVPLRWGSPRIVVVSGGFRYHLGDDLRQEPFRAARLWRYQWDSRTDLIVSRRAPERLPTYSSHNPCVNTLIQGIADRTLPGLCDRADPFGPVLVQHP